jgi:NAD(P)-dependent dehydrogenase (short-subunit alcohol dehydrogenase family)
MSGQEPGAGVPSVPLLLRGRRVIVTGAAGGIGAAVLKLFAAAGAQVQGWDQVASDGVAVCDVTDEAAVADAFEAASLDGPVTDVVHAAGVTILGPIAAMSVDEFRRVIDVNLVGSFVVARETARRLASGGSLVLVSSQAGLKNGAFWGAYGASKGGMLRLADALVEELAPRGIRVNSICPGGVETAMTDAAIEALARLKGGTAAEVRARYLSAIPMARFAAPEEVAKAALALCSDLGSYVNGAILAVDGGELSR